MSLKSTESWLRNLVVCLFGSITTNMAMTLMQPFMPLYVKQLGVSGDTAILQWSGIAYSATFVTAGLVAPLWGHLGHHYGRKAMLVRASFGMAVCVLLMGLVSGIGQLVGLRLLVGLAGGYSSGATILVAVQTPKERSGYALGLLASGVMAGNLVGPLAGGVLPPLIGIRATFLSAGALIFIAFLATLLLVTEVPRPAETRDSKGGSWSLVPHKSVVVAMLVAGFMLMIANMSIVPIITDYVQGLVSGTDRVTFIAGLVMSAAALGSVLSSSLLGRLADRIGHLRVVLFSLMAGALLLIPQAFVTASWQVIALRFLMGLALGGLLPCISAVIRHNVPEHFVGTVLGYSLSSQFAGQFVGPLIGGFVGGHIGLPYVFFVTSALTLASAIFTWRATSASISTSSTSLHS
ncbi:MFS transporter [Xanthobacter sediminis]|uniref:MFS transporter n=1 Tax=Xanthobacter sediminis TaxID=3119926 RepID=UPI003728466D